MHGPHHAALKFAIICQKKEGSKLQQVFNIVREVKVLMASIAAEKSTTKGQEKVPLFTLHIDLTIITNICSSIVLTNTFQDNAQVQYNLFHDTQLIM